MKTIKVLLIDGHPLFTRGLISLLEGMSGYSVIGEAQNSEDAVHIAENEKPSLVIMEISLGDESGLELIPRLKAAHRDIEILVLSMYDERYYSERVLRMGAQGYVMKDKSIDTVMEAIQTIMSGKIYLSESEQRRLSGDAAQENIPGIEERAIALQKLSNRELQIFTCMGNGLGTIEIAGKYKLSAKTIDTHKEHIKLKLHCSSSQELRRLAIEWINH